MTNFFKVCKKGIWLSLIIFLCILVLLGSVNAQGSKFNFQIVCGDNLYGEAGIMMQSFKSSIEYRTGGDITIDIFPSGELGGNEDEYCVQLQQGTLDFGTPSTSPIANYTNALYLFDTPFLFKGLLGEIELTFESETRHTEFVEKLLKKASEDAGFIVLTVAPMGRRDLYGHKPIRSFEDLKGLKVRVMNNPVQVDAMNFLGAIGTPLAYSECFNGLQLKVIDVMENSPSVYIDMGFHEVAPYYLGTNHYSCVQTICVSEKVWNSLPQAYKTIVKESAVGAANVLTNWAYGAHEVYLNGAAKKAAQEMHIVDDEARAKVRAEVLPKILDKYGEEIGMDILSSLAEGDEVIGKWYEANR